MRLLVIPLAAVVLLVSAGTARAQDVLVEGPGFKMGESTVFHPRIGLEGGVVSNVFYEEDNEVLSPILRLKGGFDIAPAGEDRLGEFDEQDYRTIDFRIGAEAEYTEYIKDNEDVRSQRNVDVEATGNLTFFPQGNVAFILNDKFQRVGRPTNFESNEHLDRDINAFRAELKIQPRGHTITGGPRYENVIDIFESDSVEFANRIQHIFGARVNWKFFPYSQAYIDGSIGFYDALGDNQIEGEDYKVGSTPVRAIAGLDTVVTEMTTLNAYAGYANGFYDRGPSYNSVIGGAQFGWRYFSTGRLVAGYRYDVNDSINANYYGEHHFHIGAQHQIRTVVLSANGGYRLRGYRGVPATVNPDEPSRDDTIVEAHGRIDWILYERFGIYVEYGLQSVDTDFEANMDDPSFLRQEAMLGLVAAF